MITSMIVFTMLDSTAKYVMQVLPATVAVFFRYFIAMLLSISFMVIIPLLTVMLGDEGLHGWVDRTTCETAYGLKFYMPMSDDLEVANVQKNSLAEKAGMGDGGTGKRADPLQHLQVLLIETLLRVEGFQHPDHVAV